MLFIFGIEYYFFLVRFFDVYFDFNIKVMKRKDIFIKNMGFLVFE